MTQIVFTPDVRPRLPTRPHSIGIIGCGSIVRHGHLPAYRKFGINVAALASRTAQPLKQLADQYGISNRFTDFRQLLDLPEIDVVDITVPFDEPRLEIVREACA